MRSWRPMRGVTPGARLAGRWEVRAALRRPTRAARKPSPGAIAFARERYVQAVEGEQLSNLTGRQATSSFLKATLRNSAWPSVTDGRRGSSARCLIRRERERVRTCVGLATTDQSRLGLGRCCRGASRCHVEGGCCQRNRALAFLLPEGPLNLVSRCGCTASPLPIAMVRRQGADCAALQLRAALDMLRASLRMLAVALAPRGTWNNEDANRAAA